MICDGVGAAGVLNRAPRRPVAIDRGGGGGGGGACYGSQTQRDGGVTAAAGENTLPADGEKGRSSDRHGVVTLQPRCSGVGLPVAGLRLSDAWDTLVLSGLIFYNVLNDLPSTYSQ